MMVVAKVCFLVATLFDGFAWLLQWPYLAAHWASKKFTMMGVNARMRMNGVYKP